MDYKSAYIALKQDYIKLKKEVIRMLTNNGPLMVNFDELKPLLRKLVYEFDIEFGINYYDPTNIELTKGNDQMQSKTAYTEVVSIHTHPNTLVTDNGFKFCPPTHGDIRNSMMDYINARDSFIISTEGLWVYKPNTKLIELFTKDIPSYPHDHLHYVEEGGKEHPGYLKDEADVEPFNNLMEILEANANLYNGKLAYGKDLIKWCEEVNYEPEMCQQIDLDDYIKAMNNDLLGSGAGYGFDIKLLKWDEPWTFTYTRLESDNLSLQHMKERNKLINKDINIDLLKNAVADTQTYYVVTVK